MCKKLIYLIFFTLVLGLAQGQARGAFLAAYWDGNYDWGWSGSGEGTRDALEAKGYEILSAVALKTWMDARITDGRASVVVFCRDAVPNTVAESMSATCTLRKYLNAGGKIVWYADIPFYYMAPGVSRTTWGDAGAQALLGFDTASAPRDSYDSVTFTTKGIEWGLTEKWQSRRPASASVAASENLTVLATDNAGNAAAWVKHYVPGDTARGFVRFRDADSQANVDDIMRVAEYGLMGAEALAVDPNPANKATDVPRDVVLSWAPGAFAAPTNGHKVYLSENFNDVNDGIGGITQSASSYAPPQRLDFETTYYWRVDEVNNVNPDSPWTGNVWSFTTELFAYPIDGNNITATASSTSQADMGPENTINGSGLDANDLHSVEPMDVWLSSAEPLGAWIQYEFDKIHKLYQMWVWNSNQTVEPLIGFGLKDVTIEYSTNGTDYMTLGTTHEFARAPGTAGYAHNTTIDFGGAAAKYVRLTAAGNWGGIMPQYGLSEVRFFHIPVHATEPYPDSGATDVPRDVVLGWRAGREAVTHDVYVSADEQAVIDGTAPVATVAETRHGPLALDLDTTHYWKVNEVNEAETTSTWESNIWSFTTTDHIVVDDFESYNDLDPADPASKRIFNVWIDGYDIPTNGSLVGYGIPPFCEQTIVHGGKQSMPLSYSNTGGAASSEAELTLTPAQDWTAAQVRTLAVHFHGTAGNTGQLYVKINGTKVAYDGQASNLALTGWQAWNIDLASSGASLQNVTKLAIGI
ncbi:MAG: discoidin domain-containing protein, partial [Planctomycetota bacterium]